MQIRLKNIKSWSDIPDYWKYIDSNKKVNYQSNSEDKELISILGDFVSNDDLRLQMTGIFFDKDNIVATDAHKLFIVPNEGYIEGLYELNSNKKIDARFPDYKVILGKKEERKAFLIDVFKFRTYLNTLIKAKIQSFNRVLLSVGVDNEKIGIDADNIMPVLNSFEKLGYDKVYLGYESPTRQILFCPIKEYIFDPQKSYGKVPFGLCMPVMFEDSQDLGSYNLDTDYSFEVYYELATDGIYNEDKKKVDDWMPKTDWGIPYWSKEEQNLVNKIISTGKSKRLPILKNVKVENKKLYVTNLEVNYEVHNFDVEDGLYIIVNGALVNSTDNPDSFPNKPDREFIYFQNFPYPKGFQDAVNFIGEDDLRPTMMGVHYKVGDKIEIEATNAHIAIHLEGKITNQADYPELDVIIKDPELVSQAIDIFKNEQYGGDLLLFISVSKSNDYVKIERSNAPYRSILVRNEDGRFPNIQQVKPIDSIQSLVFNCSEMSKIIKGLKGQQKKNPIGLQPQQNKTDIYSKNDGATLVGSVSSKLINTEERQPNDSYMLLAGKLQDGMMVYINDAIKEYTKTAAKYADNSTECLLNALNKSVQFTNLPNLSDIEAMRDKKPNPKKAEKQAKTSPAPASDKKKELEQAIKGLELLAKKGNKIAETTLKALKILYKKM